MLASALEGHRVWAASYDAADNPLLALEERVLGAQLGCLQGLRFIDIATGTGRWMTRAQSMGARVAGIDACIEMLQQAARKPGVSGRIALADAGRLPISNGGSELTMCSFALGYFASISGAIGEMARITRRGGRIVITDVHPLGIEAGWKRSFRAADQFYEMEHRVYAARDLEIAARHAGLTLPWRADAHFGEPEREIFARAGKVAAFPDLCRVPAVLAMSWVKP